MFSAVQQVLHYVPCIYCTVYVFRYCTMYHVYTVLLYVFRYCTMYHVLGPRRKTSPDILLLQPQHSGPAPTITRNVERKS